MRKVLQAGYVVYTAKQNKNNFKNIIKSIKLLKVTCKLLLLSEQSNMMQGLDQPQAKNFNIWHLP